MQNTFKWIMKNVLIQQPVLSVKENWRKKTKTALTEGFVKFSVCEVARFKIDFFVVVVAICFILKADKSKNFLPKVGSFERTGLA